jgi:hypothetical protein
MASVNKNEAVQVKEDFPADHDIYVDAGYTKEVDAGTDGAVILAYQGQNVEHESAVRLGLVKPTKEEKTALTPAGGATGGASK